MGIRAVRGGRVYGTGWKVGREGQGVWAGARVWCVGAPVRSRWRACVVLCRSGVLEVEFATHRGCVDDFADRCAHVMYQLVGGGERIFQGRVEAYARKDSMDGVIAAGGVLLWPGGWMLPCVGACFNLCVGASPVVGQRRLIHWHRQRMASPRW